MIWTVHKQDLLNPEAYLKEVNSPDESVERHMGNLHGELETHTGFKREFSVPDDILVNDGVVVGPLLGRYAEVRHQVK